MNSSNFIKTIGPKISYIRKSRNLTQTEAAELIGISQGFISKLEKGTYVPDLETWIRICEVYELTFVFPKWYTRKSA